jgi:hypothetical protein
MPSGLTFSNRIEPLYQIIDAIVVRKKKAIEKYCSPDLTIRDVKFLLKLFCNYFNQQLGRTFGDAVSGLTDLNYWLHQAALEVNTNEPQIYAPVSDYVNSLTDQSNTVSPADSVLRQISSLSDADRQRVLETLNDSQNS